MAQDDLFAYFGFGSLVNRKTLPSNIVAAVPAKLKGWKRHWQSRPSEPFADPARQSIALLSIHEEPDCIIDGLVIVDHMSNLEALDERERSYDKVSLERSSLLFDSNDLEDFSEIPVHVYVSPQTGPDHQPLTILRSYLDVVFQGFRDVYGEEAIEEFINTTDGFHLPIDEDREFPKYPRHLQISAQEAAIFNQVLQNQCWHK